MPIGHLAGGDIRLAAEDPLAGRETTAVLAGASGVGQEAPFLDQPGIARLEDFDRHHPAIAVDRVLRVVAIGRHAPTPADQLDVVAGEILVVLLVVSAENKIDVRRALGRHRAVRHDRRKGADHRARDPRMRFRVAADLRGGIVDVHDGPRRRHDLDRTEASRILRDRRDRSDAEARYRWPTRLRPRWR